MKIALVYIGLPRFKNIGLENHKSFIDGLKSIADVTVYDYTQPNLDRSTCPTTIPAQIQVWDFYQTLKLIEEDIIIKIRTDVWFAENSANIILEKFNEFIINNLSVLYIGSDDEDPYTESNFFMHQVHVKYPVKDLIIIARKNKLLSYENFLRKSKFDKKQRRGNYLFRYIIADHTNCFNLGTKIFLIRQEYNNYPNDVTVVKDWAVTYKDGLCQYNKWIEAHE